MTEEFGDERSLAGLVVVRVGSVVTCDDIWEPVRLIDSAGEVVAAVAAFLKELQAVGRSVGTHCSYPMDLLRWFRFCWAIEMLWDRATRVEARDFCRLLALRDKPTRAAARGGRQRGTPNPVTGKPSLGGKYAAATRAHSETVLRVFYDFHVGIVTLWRWTSAHETAGVAGSLPAKTGPKVPSKLTEGVAARIRDLDAQGLSLAAVGARTGVSTATVRVALGRGKGSAGWESRQASATAEPVAGEIDAGTDADAVEVLPVVPMPQPRTTERALARTGELVEAPVVFTPGGPPAAGRAAAYPARPRGHRPGRGVRDDLRAAAQRVLRGAGHAADAVVPGVTA
jgi:transposase